MIKVVFDKIKSFFKNLWRLTVSLFEFIKMGKFYKVITDEDGNKYYIDTKLNKGQDVLVGFKPAENKRDVTIPNSVTGIFNDAFRGADITEVVIPYGVRCIGHRAFKDCKALTKVVVPDSVVWICDGAFKGCESLTSIDIPKNVKTIRRHTFAGCKALTKVVILNVPTVVLI